jgi:hypothetical protein
VKPGLLFNAVLLAAPLMVLLILLRDLSSTTEIAFWITFTIAWNLGYLIWRRRGALA